MKDLKIQNGDLVLNESGLEMTSAAEKVAQDLRYVILNQLNFNRFTPNIGSSIDNYIGIFADEEMLHEIRQAIRAAIKVYQDEQLGEIQERIDTYGDPIYAIGLSEPDSIVKEWNQVEAQVRGDRVVVGIKFTTFTEDTDFAYFGL